jgi:hypothetical protein
MKKLSKVGKGKVKKRVNIDELRKRLGIKEHWGVSDAVVQQMAECRWFNPRIPGQAARNHALRPTFPSKFYRDSALNLARMAEEQPETMSVFVLGQIIEYHLLADSLSKNQEGVD